MPAGFDKCVKDGGKVRTVAVKGKKGKYLHVCYLGDKSYSGEVKTKQQASELVAYLNNQGYIEQNGELIKGSETMLKKLIPQIELSEKIFSAKNKESEIEILHAGVWEHPNYGEVKITEEDIDKFIQAFDDKVRRVDIAVDQEHMPEKGAAGWYRSLSKVFEDGKIKLKAIVEWTKLGTQLIQDGIFKYFSPEFDFAYEDQETHEQFENVLLGGALTNRPYFKSLAPVALSENMFAGFTNNNKSSKKGVNMNKDELKAKLAEDSKFVLSKDASDEEKKAFEEAQVELAKDAEDAEEARKAQEEADAKVKAEEGAVKASERFISKADHEKQMNEMRSKMGVMETKLRFKEVSEEVEGYVFSTSNQSGVLLPKNKDGAVKLMMALTSKTAPMFTEFLKGLPAVSAKLFTEQGGEGSDATKQEKLDAEVEKIVKEKGMKYTEALKIVAVEKPELLK
jgi:hypothetical protein